MSRKGLLFNRRSLSVFAVIFVLAYSLVLGSFERHDEVLAGQNFPAPNFSVERLEGGKVSLSDYRGKWVLINFWATWCGPCVEEMPSLEAFYNNHKGDNFTVMAISLDRGSKEKVEKFVKRLGLTFEIFHDPKSISSGLFNVSALPATFVVNPTGDVVAQAIGPRDWEDPVIVDYFKDLMNLK